MQLQMLCYKLLKKIFITGLLIVATVPHDDRKRYNSTLTHLADSVETSHSCKLIDCDSCVSPELQHFRGK